MPNFSKSGGGTLESHQKNITKDLKRDPGAIDS